MVFIGSSLYRFIVDVVVVDGPVVDLGPLPLKVDLEVLVAGSVSDVRSRRLV